MEARITNEETAAGGADSIAVLAAPALQSAARRLGVDPMTLAAACTHGELADVIIELRLARFTLPAADQERVEILLRRIGVLP